ncbi:MAG: phosphate signaling complex protein PhoU [Anaeroplasmataceae bacterium]
MLLDKQIEKLNVLIKEMSILVQNNIRQAVGLYLNKVEDLNINDEVVNQYERLIDEVCIDILIKERPYSRDLRELSAVLKLVSDIERLGDHAKDIETFSRKLKGSIDERNPKIELMLNKALKMVDDAILSFMNMDNELAVKTVKADDEIDDLYDEIIEELTSHPINTHSDQCFVIYTTLIVKYIERIADHATNISEWVVYIIKGIFKEDIINL